MMFNIRVAERQHALPQALCSHHSMDNFFFFYPTRSSTVRARGAILRILRCLLQWHRENFFLRSFYLILNEYTPCTNRSRVNVQECNPPPLPAPHQIQFINVHELLVNHKRVSHLYFYTKRSLHNVLKMDILVSSISINRSVSYI